jgi:hypothetical protein
MFFGIISKNIEKDIKIHVVWDYLKILENYVKIHVMFIGAILG